VLVALAQLGSVAMVGHYALASAVVIPVYQFANLQLRPLHATDSTQRFLAADYLRLRLLTTTFVTLLVLFGALWWAPRELIALIVVLALAKAAEGVSDIYYGRLEQSRRMDHVGRSLAFRGVLSFTLFLWVFWTFDNLLAACIALLLARVFVLGLHDVPRRGGATEEVFPLSWMLSSEVRKTLAGLLIQGLPLALTMLLLAICEQLPKYLTQHFLGAADLGVFAALAYFPLVGMIIVQALGRAAAPSLADSYKTNPECSFPPLLLKLTVLAGAIGVAGLIMAVFVGKQSLQLLYGTEYASHSAVLAVLMASGALWYVAALLGVAATARRRLGLQPVVLTVGTLVLAVLGKQLVPTLGIAGIAWSMLLSAGVIVVCYAALLAPKAHR
jgi:O-antigen/teichoic acid export membrane protein